MITVTLIILEVRFPKVQKVFQLQTHGRYGDSSKPPSPAPVLTLFLHGDAGGVTGGGREWV